jgi:sigma-B regulation protein RsbU (phosphoserine phosphatase)
LEKSMLFTDARLESYQKELLEFYRDNHTAAALPFYSHEGQLIGVLLLGSLKDGSPYSVDLVSALDIYRIHFEASLANSLYLEEITASQIAEHDRMVVETIRKKILPKKLKQIEGMRVSSIYLGNHEFGGDFFDTISVRPDKLGIFMTTVADTGIDSSLVALEFYTVLYTQPTSYDSPEKFMNILNWVITTSRFSDVYAPAYYAVYSPASKTLWYCNAAMKPLVLYDPAREVFAELDTNGIPVGIDKNFTYEVKSQQLSPGCIGFLYSGGMESALNRSGNTYSTGRIKDIIRLNRDDTPAVLVRKIFTDFKNFVQDARLVSDVSLVVFRIY